jgi:hypothetical protein
MAIAKSSIEIQLLPFASTRSWSDAPFDDKAWHSFGRFLGLIGATGFPNQAFNDSWAVGF